MLLSLRPVGGPEPGHLLVPRLHRGMGEDQRGGGLVGAETQNCVITIYRGTTSNQFGDQVDSNVPYISDLPVTLIETGKTVQDPSTPTPRTIRDVKCIVPHYAGLLDTDRILDQATGDIYIVISVTKPPTIIGAPVDTIAQLKRISANTT